MDLLSAGGGVLGLFDDFFGAGASGDGDRGSSRFRFRCLFRGSAPSRLTSDGSTGSADLLMLLADFGTPCAE